MINEAAAAIPFWMLLAAILAFRMGDKVGYSRRHRQSLEEANENLRDELKKDRSKEPPHRALKQQRGVIHDTHKHVVAVSKGLEKPAS
jgi:hypothetical protein